MGRTLAGLNNLLPRLIARFERRLSTLESAAPGLVDNVNTLTQQAAQLRTRLGNDETSINASLTALQNSVSALQSNVALILMELDKLDPGWRQ